MSGRGQDGDHLYRNAAPLSVWVPVWPGGYTGCTYTTYEAAVEATVRSNAVVIRYQVAGVADTHDPVLPPSPAATPVASGPSPSPDTSPGRCQPVETGTARDNDGGAG